MSLCSTGCNFYAVNASGLCSSCTCLKAVGQPLKTPAQLEAERRASADLEVAKTFLALYESRGPDAERAVDLYKHIALNGSSLIATPHALWTLFEGDGANTRVLLRACEAVPLFAIYERREPDGWLYGHVIAARVLDNWNLSGCSSNTLGYGGGGSTVDHARTLGVEYRLRFVRSQLNLID